MSTTFALIIEIYYIYKVFHDERDFMLENIIKNNDSIVVLDFGLKYHKFKDYISK